jgi:dTDP-4-amino-4,6-dideoxygalactose transaminase
MRLWFTGFITNSGYYHIKLSKLLQYFLYAENIALFSNGHLALEAALELIPSKSGEVITTPFTFSSTTQAIIRKGFDPQFCDINLEDFTIDTNQIESLINSNTVAVLAVNVFGSVCDLEQLERICKFHNLVLIYDSAHAFGVKFKGMPVSMFGDFNMFSFHATKVFHTIEGGAFTFRNSKLIERVNAIKNFGYDSQYKLSYSGGNAKMNEFQSIMGILNLESYHINLKKRKKISEYYTNFLCETENLKLTYNQPFVESNYSYFPVIILNNDVTELIDYMQMNNITVRRYFYPLTSEMPLFGDVYDSNLTPNAKYISDRVVCLPIFPTLKLSEVKYISLTLLSFFK